MVRSSEQDKPGTSRETIDEAVSPPPLADFLTRAATIDPDRPAITEADETIDYRELDARVRAMTHSLTTSGVGAGSVVAVCVPRSITAAVGIHAAVRLGAVVAPLDPADPPARLQSMLRTGDADLLVIERARLDTLTDLDMTELIPVDERSVVIARLASPRLDSHRLDSHRADQTTAPKRSWAADGGYLLFTSGSTGAPKGVLLGFDAVAHFAAWAARTAGLTPDDRVCAQAALTFDLSTFDLFATAYAHSSSVLLPDWLKPFPRDTAEWLAQQRITAIYAVPTLLRGIVGAGDALPELRTVLYAGEPYPPQALAALLERLPAARVFNFYGPTETNVCTFAEISGGWQDGTPVPIGAGIADVRVEIVDADLRPCSGEGELVVARPTLLDGYLIDGALVDPTVPVAFSDGVTRRSYRTGDRAVAGPDGQILLRGRRDAQIKRRGYRIDLTGIERIVADVPTVRTAAVTSCDDLEVVLFVEADRSPTTESKVASAIGNALPTTHHPDRTVWVDRIPRNSRGKIDYPQLRPIAFPDARRREESHGSK